MAIIYPGGKDLNFKEQKISGYVRDKLEYIFRNLNNGTYFHEGEYIKNYRISFDEDGKTPWAFEIVTSRRTSQFLATTPVGKDIIKMLNL